MENPKEISVNEAVSRVIQKEKNRYLNIKALITRFSVEIKQKLGFEKNVKSKDFTAKHALDRLDPYLNEKTSVYRKGNLIYISLDSKEIMILRKLRQSKSFPTFKMLRKNVTPLLNDVFTQTLNSLLISGQVKCTFKGDNPVLSLADPVLADHFQPAEALEPVEPEKEVFLKQDTEPADDARTFQAALNTVGKGRRLVYIYQVRQHLNWSRDRFDQLIRKLRGEYEIQLHGGDPSVMTEDQVKDSFMDEKGILHISVSWRGK
jgi:DNA-binding HxlR family transcriptional regulator